MTDVPFPHIWTGSISRTFTFRATRVFSFRLPLRFLLTGGNVNSYPAETYAPRLRHIFGCIKVGLFAGKIKPFRAQVSLFHPHLSDLFKERVSTETKWNTAANF